jgi:hypothetical protein
MEKFYIDCSCHGPNHMIRFQHDNEFLYIDTQLSSKFGFWKRLWIGLKYIFNLGSDSYYNWNDTLLRKEEVKPLSDFINSYLYPNF